MRKLVLFALLGCCAGCSGGGEARLRRALAKSTGVAELPGGEFEIRSELVIPRGAHDLEIRGAEAGTVIRAAKGFQGRALFRLEGGSKLRLTGLDLDGNREELEKPAGLPPSDVPFARASSVNGILAGDVAGLEIKDIDLKNVPAFSILVSRSGGVVIRGVTVRDSGSKNAKGRNNTTGGILLEEGTDGFEIRFCALRNIRGNGIWTHSLYTSPRSRNGLIADNRFETIGRDAIQVGHATNIRVENNRGQFIGFPAELVDAENAATPVGIDTAGNVDRSVYAGNQFEEVNGKCIDLDGFHDGEVRGNVCLNRGAADEYPFGHYAIVFNNTNPDMQSQNIAVTDNEIDGTKFGGIFVIGAGHRILRNRLRRVNLAGCNESAAKYGCSHFPGEPDLLQSGIYLGRRAERPAVARGVVVEDNQISGYKMKSRCIGIAPGVALAQNTVRNNACSGE